MDDPRLAAQEAGHKAFREVPCGLKDAVTAAINAALDAVGPDPEDEAMVAKLAHALACAPFDGDYDAVPPDEVFRRVRYAHLKFMYERQAKAVLTALRDAARGAGG